MNQPMTNVEKRKVARWLLYTLIIVAVLATMFFVWFYLMGPGKKAAETTPAPITQTSDTTDKNTITSTGTTTNTTTTTGTAAATNPIDDWLIFEKPGYGFTFKYPKDWKIASNTDEPMTGNPTINQKEVKITDAKGNSYELSNPSAQTGFVEYSLGNEKEIKASEITFDRLYGQDAQKTLTLYAATYADPNNLDAASISFFGTSSDLNEAEIATLDKILSTFTFTL